MSVAARIGPGRPERDAQDVLDTIWAELVRGGEPRIPVDPIAIARRLGIKVYTAGLPEGMSGMLVKPPGDDPAIYLHDRDHENRQRFTCAHELGHYIRRTQAGDDDWLYIDHRSPLSSTGLDSEERYANQFAASLLMPRTLVEREAERHGPATLAYRFGVSAEAMNYRLDNLRLR